MKYSRYKIVYLQMKLKNTKIFLKKMYTNVEVYYVLMFILSFIYKIQFVISEETPTVLAASTASEITEKVGKTQAAVCNTTGDATNTLSQLVTEAVKKVLAEQQVIDKEEISQNIVSKVVEQLKPTLAGSLQSNSVVVEPPPKPIVSSSTCTYNPTPISELKKRHISIPIYNPVRESKVTVKRKGIILFSVLLFKFKIFSLN